MAHMLDVEKFVVNLTNQSYIVKLCLVNLKEYRHVFLCTTYGPQGSQQKHDCALTQMSA